MELNGFNREFAVTNAHNDAVIRFGCNFEARRKGFAVGVEGMIAAHTEWRRQAPKYAFALVGDE